MKGAKMSNVQTPEDVRDAVVKKVEHAADRVGGEVGTRVGVTGTKIGVKGSKLGARGLLFGAKAGAREKLRPAREAKLKADLSRTSHKLAHETEDLGETIESLNEVIRSNRKAGAVGRTRLVAGILIGTVLTYHLDAEHGRARRAATGERVKRLLVLLTSRG
jgi:hypothetical protein